MYKTAKVSKEFFSKKKNIVEVKISEPGKAVVYKPYAEYLIELQLDRKLRSFETVKHLDGNKMNNKLDNLKLVTKDKVTRKNSKHPKSMDFTCAHCHKVFKLNGMKLLIKLNDLKKSKTGNVFCDRTCYQQFKKNVKVDQYKPIVNKTFSFFSLMSDIKQMLFTKIF